MDLKVEIQPARSEIQQRSDADPNDDDERRLSNYNRFMCPISMPWKHAFSKKQIESGSSRGTRTSSSDDVFKVTNHFHMVAVLKRLDHLILFF